MLDLILCMYPIEECLIWKFILEFIKKEFFGHQGQCPFSFSLLVFNFLSKELEENAGR